ncbi:ubiquinol-cytochrome c reductase iron-sulfur subunit [Fictibacillus enclensis]|uniref:Menaquinol:cytochrome c reductase iron-sulfur subunit n=2 Tax=Fictibacillus TaxID=1329200 RepID=A0A0V8JER4_9BACL|nr:MULTISPECIES: ubiquinol-cytochrome c reductase iron-sulfur subunit [Fictibacillus]KSU85571.1 menaquinol-cytochrome C reductase [Fictibacillus enclensis]MDM5199507.1 ubiquinol-cytochrome c reductase iron-sulfur subunit [Fictibacillus enclensis]MDM5338744.1 ubiquinol-cytochrome c reductase iron-sulfur subunit [Fictibacillus enclensis]RXY98738.1 ubiquinol-cytochrome c reductase iron-sulfur subunit [Fictibacillus sp. S7]WHY70241.1 ubiquinol-cytochrome c reductase iron-sulfur subunit [Fictibacil
MSKEDISRRQFLNYTLTGVGGFMAAGMLMPMVRFAIDPILEKGASQDMVAVTEVSKIGKEPKRFNFKIKQKDGWYESEVTQSAWVYKNGKGELIALSPVCKHLGCTIDWNTDPAHPNQFYCPCHGGRYEKDGTNIKGTPPLAPLDVYDSQVKDGKLYLGKAKPRKGA